MSHARTQLIAAEAKAAQLFADAVSRGIIVAGRTETEINTDIFALAEELFGIEKYWHKRIVRAGPNTLHPYYENPPDLTLRDDDILFLDFGPIFEEWEADYGRTFVIGDDPYKLKLRDDTERAWHDARAWFDGRPDVTGAEFFHFILGVADAYGWEYGNEMAGHLIGQFPHERLEKENYGLYIHPENHNKLSLPDKDGNPRHWILEIHFVDREREIGGFFEQLLV